MAPEEWVLWCSVAAVFYVYFGYPATLLLLPRLQRKREELPPPSVSILIAAYNEEKVIQDNIDNKLSLDYPPSLVEIIVISDGSTDRTDEIVRSYANRRVRLIRQEPRQGKTTGLNRAAAEAKGDLLVFADANSIYEPGALRHLAAEFGDLGVGYTTGRLAYQDPGGTAVGAGSGLYMRYEDWVRRLESRVGSVIGVNGGIDAVRKNLYQPMRADQLPDFVLPLRVIEQGFRVSYCPAAVLYEDALQSSEDEFKMRVRVCLRTYNALWDMKRLLLPIHGVVSFQIFLHKIARYAVFALLPLILVMSILLIRQWPYLILLSCQAVFYLLAFLGAVLEKRLWAGLHLAPFYFTLINLAAAVAFLRFLTGDRQVTWKPRRGN